jgi:hypothetical protein
MPSITHNEPFFSFWLPPAAADPPVARFFCHLEWRRSRRSRVPPAAPLAGAAQSTPPPPPPVWSGPEHVAPPRPWWYEPRSTRAPLAGGHAPSARHRRRPSAPGWSRPVHPSPVPGAIGHASSASLVSGQARTQGARRPHHRSPWCSTGRARPSLLIDLRL